MIQFPRVQPVRHASNGCDRSGANGRKQTTRPTTTTTTVSILVKKCPNLETLYLRYSKIRAGSDGPARCEHWGWPGEDLDWRNIGRKKLAVVENQWNQFLSVSQTLVNFCLSAGEEEPIKAPSVKSLGAMKRKTKRLITFLKEKKSAERRTSKEKITLEVCLVQIARLWGDKHAKFGKMIEKAPLG